MPCPFPISALEAVEFPKVLHWVAGFTATPPGRRILLDLLPGGDASGVEACRQRGKQALQGVVNGAMPGLSRGGDVTKILELVERGSADGEDFVVLVDTLDLAVALSRMFPKTTDTPFAKLLRTARIPRGLLERFQTCLDEQGHVLDEADSTLAEARRQIQVLFEQRRHQMDALAESLDRRGVLRQRQPVQRANHLLFAVRATHAGRLRGIVHDRSQSGDTVFIEPEDLIPLSNRLAEWKAKERQRVHAVFQELSRETRRFADDLRKTEEVIAWVDVAYASAKWAEQVQAHWCSQGGGVLQLRGARHPLLVRKGEPVIPLNLDLGGAYDMLVVTGPNTGGKTVVLKTVGVLAAMQEVGLPVTAEEGTVIPSLSGLQADIGDAQSLESSLSTFSGHVRRIQEILDEAAPDSLVLLDELGTGTDPEEGAAIGQAVLEALLKKGVLTVANTHLGQLKLFSVGVARAENASMEFNPESLAPSYRLLVGVPGASHAIEVVEHLGFPSEVLNRARELAQRKNSAEGLLADVGRVRRTAQELREQAAEQEVETRRVLNAAKATEESAKERAQLRQQEAERAFLEHRRMLECLLEEEGERLMAGMKGHQKEEVDAMFQLIRTSLQQCDLGARWTQFVHSLKKGRIVWLPRLREHGRVVKVQKKKERARVLVGQLEMDLPFRDLTWADAPPPID